jgi:hypothetical protein
MIGTENVDTMHRFVYYELVVVDQRLIRGLKLQLTGTRTGSSCYELELVVIDNQYVCRQLNSGKCS